MSGGSQLGCHLIYLKLYRQSVSEHLVSGINIRNSGVFCLLGLLLEEIAVGMAGRRGRKDTKKEGWYTFFDGIMPGWLAVKSRLE